jgi:rhodanese-related sulfurtransferase
MVTQHDPDTPSPGSRRSRLQARVAWSRLALLAWVMAVVAGPMAAPAAAIETSAVPAEKQTTLGLYLTAREAYEKWKATPDKVTVLDVRTPEEFLFIGHAEMAWNVPFAAQSYQWDAGKKRFPMRPLPDFVARVQKVAEPDDTLLVMCRSGGRSAMAVNRLAEAGFKNVYNIVDGMEGDSVKDPDSLFHGQRLVNGWKNSGLPWTYEVDPGRMLFSPAP